MDSAWTPDDFPLPPPRGPTDRQQDTRGPRTFQNMPCRHELEVRVLCSQPLSQSDVEIEAEVVSGHDTTCYMYGGEIEYM